MRTSSNRQHGRVEIVVLLRDQAAKLALREKAFAVRLVRPHADAALIATSSMQACVSRCVHSRCIAKTTRMMTSIRASR